MIDGLYGVHLSIFSSFSPTVVGNHAHYSQMTSSRRTCGDAPKKKVKVKDVNFEARGAISESYDNDVCHNAH